MKKIINILFFAINFKDISIFIQKNDSLFLQNTLGVIQK